MLFPGRRSMFSLDDLVFRDGEVSHYDVRLTSMPELPITWEGTPELRHYAESLQDALERGIITEPGMYRIVVKSNPLLFRTMAIFNYEIHKFDESGPDDPALD
jgi:hypothetical protein